MSFHYCRFFLANLQPAEICVTKGHSLPTRYIIHTVCPNYNQKNRVASIWSEKTLHLCYRNVLSKAKELGLQTIGLCTLSVPQRNYPSDVGAHIALSNSLSTMFKYILKMIFIFFRDSSKVFRDEQSRSRHFMLGAIRGQRL